jgi:nucleoside-diphosphate-sugar epimerase
MIANIDTLKSLGWAPKFCIEAGIKKTIETDMVK